MAESVSISPLPPDFKSMQFEYLRSEGLRHIQNLSGKIWTNYNLSDPGVSILEVLSYAITDLGYRTSYPIPDILAQNPAVTQFNSKNFYTASQILPVNPVTINDYRKQLIDCEVYDTTPGSTCSHVGVKNAWVDIIENTEVPIFVNDQLKKLSYTATNNPIQIKPGILYNVLLELGYCEKYGDLNETTMEGYVTISECNPTVSMPDGFPGMKVKIIVEFPRWDDDGINWDDKSSIKSKVKKITLNFPNFPDTYKLEGYGFDGNKDIYVRIYQNTPSNLLYNICECIESQINNLVFDNGSTSLISLYQGKVKKIQEIITEARKTLMAHRNLGEDFFKISALKVEEVAMCADIEVEAKAHIEEIEAKIYHELGKFISPTVRFYSLEEMYEKGKTTEEIFDGPALKHGFIDDNELENAKRRKMINVSDLINIIMDIPGVVAVKKIQIANIPQDNDDNITSKTVKWQLKLAYDKNYVPRLSPELSKVNFFKGPLPFIAHESEVDTHLQILEDAAPPQKILDAVVDLPVPDGEYKQIAEYVSTQDEFPQVYGIGPEGLPSTADNERIAQARQMKGFLMFFDQLLTNYLAQLQGVKELFSMNMEPGQDTDYKVNKSYFTQSLKNAVTGFNHLRGAASDSTYENNVQKYTENPDLFNTRRNRFLDHLMARFSEQFTDYAMLVYRLRGKKASAELITDKLELLNAYPEISANRLKSFDYENQQKLWHPDNTAGYEKRIAFLNGINPRKPGSLYFKIVIPKTPGTYNGYEIRDSNNNIVLESTQAGFTRDEWNTWIETVLINGVQRERYQVISSGQVVATPAINGTYTYRLMGDDGILGSSPAGASYNGAVAVEAAIDKAIKTASEEFYNNSESNRLNLATPIRNYFNPGTPVVDMTTNPPHYTYTFSLYKEPFKFSGGNTILLTGTYKGLGLPKTAAKIKAVTANNTIQLWGDYTAKIQLSNPSINIIGSASNDGVYTVSAVSHSAGISTVTITANTLSTTGSQGSLYYNTQTSSQLLAIANSNINETLFEVAYYAAREGSYKVKTQADATYRMNILDRCSDVLATSQESNFSNEMAAQAIGGSVVLSGSASGNNGTYTVEAGTDARENRLRIIVAAVLTRVSGGLLSIKGNFNINTVDQAGRSFKILNKVLNRVLLAGETITVVSSTLEEFTYTVKKVLVDSSGHSFVYVNESIKSYSGSLNKLEYDKNLSVLDIVPGASSSTIIARFDADIQAMNELLEFVNEKFMNHEGMHLVENFLLRPKTNTTAYVPLEADNSFVPRASADGYASYTKFYTVAGVDVNSGNHSFIITGNKVSEFNLSLFGSQPFTISIKGSVSGVNDNTYTVTNVSLNGSGNTLVRVFGTIPKTTGLNNYGELYFRKRVATLGFSANSVTITETIAAISKTYPLITSATTNAENDGTYIIERVVDPGVSTGNAQIIVNRVLTNIQDDFLGINFDSDCEDCNFTDPYSFVGSIIMPYWPGRFANLDFRYYFEQTLRLECPAHIALNVCWINSTQMQEFEVKYKKWLVENARLKKDKRRSSETLNDLIDILERLRSVNPKGTLHDCDQDPELKNSIILNKTTIGNLQL